MSLNFSANQFEEEFKPARLRNWEVPKWFPKHPCQNHGTTHVISNERGHLLPGVPRCPCGPWGDFVGTWDLPKKISRKTANELSAPNKNRIARWRTHCRISTRKAELVKMGKPPQVSSEKFEEKFSDSSVPLNKSEGVQTEEIPRALCPIHDIVYWLTYHLFRVFSRWYVRFVCGIRGAVVFQHVFNFFSEG